MKLHNNTQAWILGISLIAGLSSLGFFISDALVNFKAAERTVTVKGLAERETPADIVIWPIQFTVADNQLENVYVTLENNTQQIQHFLTQAGIHAQDISVSAPGIIDKVAQQFGGGPRAEFRFSAKQTVTVYSENVDKVRSLMNRLGELGKTGIVFSADGYQNQVQYLYTRLNEIKPEMIQEATTKAREVAQKFAEDSASQLGRIKRASQGSFSISSRDSNNPHIKKIRVVSTIEYFLSD